MKTITTYKNLNRVSGICAEEDWGEESRVILKYMQAWVCVHRKSWHLILHFAKGKRENVECGRIYARCRMLMNSLVLEPCGKVARRGQVTSGKLSQPRDPVILSLLEWAILERMFLIPHNKKKKCWDIWSPASHCTLNRKTRPSNSLPRIAGVTDEEWLAYSGQPGMHVVSNTSACNWPRYLPTKRERGENVKEVMPEFSCLIRF